MRWEYFVWWGNGLTYSVLATADDDGWELVTVISPVPTPELWSLQAVFKRPKVTP